MTSLTRWSSGVYVAIALVSLTTGAQNVYVGPVDEATMDPAIVEVRQRTLGAVRQRNKNALSELAEPHGGLPAQILRIHLADDSVWRAAETALAHGGRFLVNGNGERLFCSPWAVSSPHFVDPPAELLGPEGLAPAAVLEPSPVFADRSLTGQPLVLLPPGYVRVVQEVMPSDGVVAVEIPVGRHGWMARGVLWTESDIPLCFGMRDGLWWLVRMGS